MNVGKVIEVGVIGVAVVAATASCIYSWRTYRKAKAKTEEMKASNDAFEAEIINNLRDIGGEEMVASYRARMAAAGY